jgi:hypothetical protein
MSSSEVFRRVDAAFDQFEAAEGRLLASSFESFATPELLELLERRAFLVGRIDALIYELTSAFARWAG